MKTKRITLNAQLQTRIELRLYCLDGRRELLHQVDDPDSYYGVNLSDNFNYKDRKALAEKAKSKTKFINGGYRFGSNKHSEGERVFAYQVFEVTRIIDDRSGFGHKSCETDHVSVTLTKKVFIGDSVISRVKMKKEANWVRKAGKEVDKLPRHHEDYERMQAEFVGRKVSRSTPHGVSLALGVYRGQRLFIKIGDATFVPLGQKNIFQPW